jgi:membrane fusion protein, multidrug efflux system
VNKGQVFPKERRRLIIFGAVVVVITLALLLILVIERGSFINTEIKTRTDAVNAGPEVRVADVKRSPEERTITLVGEARPYAAVTLYGKVSGYLKEIRVDKGDRIKKGQIIAVIESPELDRQYDLALADAQDKRRDAVRAKALLGKGYISQQDADHADTAARQSEANAAAFRIQKYYQVLRAPFSGTVSARFVDPGALIQSAVSSQTTALPVVNISATDRLRVFIYLDQHDAVFVRLGDNAVISDSARPDVRLKASVTRISGELDQKTRTLLTELDVDNSKELILAGSFVQVSLTLKTTPLVEIPAEALLIKSEKNFVAVITPDSKVNFRPVVIADSDAKMVRISSGLAEGERVALNPGWGISEGDHVRPVGLSAK